MEGFSGRPLGRISRVRIIQLKTGWAQDAWLQRCHENWYKIPDFEEMLVRKNGHCGYDLTDWTGKQNFITILSRLRLWNRGNLPRVSLKSQKSLLASVFDDAIIVSCKRLPLSVLDSFRDSYNMAVEMIHFIRSISARAIYVVLCTS